MKFLLILSVILIACNSDKATSVEVMDSGIKDSTIVKADSLNDGLRDMLVDLRQTKRDVKSEIARLKAENKGLRAKTGDVDAPVSMSYDALYDNDNSSNKDKIIRDLMNELNAYKIENTRLRNKLRADSVFRTNVGKVPNKLEQALPKPDDKSLVITLKKQLRGDGDISDAYASVYLIPLTNKAKKLKSYDAACDMTLINSLGSRRAEYYEGKYFFNGVGRGKYLVKVCALFGNWTIVKKEDKYLEVAMEMSPPIQ